MPSNGYQVRTREPVPGGKEDMENQTEISEEELLRGEILPEYDLEEDHGVYVAFRYGVVYSFIAVRAAGTRRYRVSRVTYSEDGGMILTFISSVHTLPEARAVAQVHLKRLLETQESARVGGQ